MLPPLLRREYRLPAPRHVVSPPESAIEERESYRLNRLPPERGALPSFLHVATIAMSAMPSYCATYGECARQFILLSERHLFTAAGYAIGCLLLQSAYAEVIYAMRAAFTTVIPLC